MNPNDVNPMLREQFLKDGYAICCFRTLQRSKESILKDQISSIIEELPVPITLKNKTAK